MKTTALLLGSLLAVANASVYVPMDIPDGLYYVHVDSSGNPVGDPVFVAEVTDINSTTIEARAEAAIPGPQSRCRGYGYNGNDYPTAFACLGNWCDSGYRIPVGTTQYCANGASVAYICNHASGTQPCGSSENREFNTLLDIACGTNQAGHIWVPDWGKSFGRGVKGELIC